MRQRTLKNGDTVSESDLHHALAGLKQIAGDRQAIKTVRAFSDDQLGTPLTPKVGRQLHEAGLLYHFEDGVGLMDMAVRAVVRAAVDGRTNHVTLDEGQLVR